MENRSTPLRSREWTCSGHPDQGDGTSTWKRGNCYSTVCFTVQASNRPDTWITCGRHSTNDPAVIEATCGWGDPDAPERIVWRLSDGVATATGDAGFGPASWTCIGSPGVNRHRCEGTIGDPIFTSGVPVVFGTHF